LPGARWPTKRVSEGGTNADILLSEVGAWFNNPIHLDAAIASKSIAKCQQALADAERIEALCAVNIVGSCNPEQWDGPHPKNLTRETFDAVVQSTRAIVDGVRPRRAKYVLETMPWIFPDSPESYLELLKAIDRDTVGVHLDIANMVNCPTRLFNNTAFIHHCFDLLGNKVVAIACQGFVVSEQSYISHR
jgi:sugar phosphate isomerase/epimerase